MTTAYLALSALCESHALAEGSEKRAALRSAATPGFSALTDETGCRFGLLGGRVHGLGVRQTRIEELSFGVNHNAICAKET